jgi:hypothetical protein
MLRIMIHFISLRVVADELLGTGRLRITMTNTISIICSDNEFHLQNFPAPNDDDE